MSEHDNAPSPFLNSLLSLDGKKKIREKNAVFNPTSRLLLRRHRRFTRSHSCPGAKNTFQRAVWWKPPAHPLLHLLPVQSQPLLFFSFFLSGVAVSLRRCQVVVIAAGRWAQTSRSLLRSALSKYCHLIFKVVSILQRRLWEQHFQCYHNYHGYKADSTANIKICLLNSLADPVKRP